MNEKTSAVYQRRCQQIKRLPEVNLIGLVPVALKVKLLEAFGRACLDGKDVPWGAKLTAANCLRWSHLRARDKRTAYARVCLVLQSRLAGRR